MNINRHNYEEFFLLYVDKELTPSQLTEVEIFLQQNPDLLPELAMLQQVVLSENNEIAFLNKNLLYKTEQGINHQNYEEYFLLYVDNELGEAEKTEVEKFVLQHPSLQEAFTILRATRLEPETIAFAHKESLYRSNEQNERVIPLGWFRVAAAAAVMGIIALFWFKGSNNGNVTVVPGIAHENVELKKDTAQLGRSATNGEPQLAISKHPGSETQDKSKKATKVVEPQEKSIAAKNKPGNKLLQTTHEEDNLPATVETNTFAAAQTIATQDNRKNVISTDQPGPKNSAPKTSEPIAVSGNNNTPIHQAVYQETAEEDDRSIYIGGAEINRNKLRGLFKKAAGIFVRKGKKADDDNVVQIASFEIKTK